MTAAATSPSKQPKNQPGKQPWHIAAFYQFKAVEDPQKLVDQLQCFMAEFPNRLKPDSHSLLGTVLVASEGINGTIAGDTKMLETVFKALHEHGFDQLVRRNTQGDKPPFHRLRVRLKKEIVSMGQPQIDPKINGQYIEPEQWDELIADPNVMVIDTRNEYETCLGTFAGAITPDTDSFRDFPAWATQNVDPAQHKQVAMFCTGGIRCEKATAYLKAQGIEDVYHLHGGILNYLERVPEAQSSWQGECFVFDDRVTVDHNLKAGNHEQCFNCRMPLSEEALADERFERHVSCHYCFDRVDEKRRQSLLERARQMRLARERGETHLGAQMPLDKTP